MLKPKIGALQISEVAQCGTDQRKKENIQGDVHPGDNSRQGLKCYQRSFIIFILGVIITLTVSASWPDLF